MVEVTTNRRKTFGHRHVQILARVRYLPNRHVTHMDSTGQDKTEHARAGIGVGKLTRYSRYRNVTSKEGVRCWTFCPRGASLSREQLCVSRDGKDVPGMGS
jgi:hypothetical protein